MNMDTKEGVTDSRAAVRRARELADTAAEQYDEQSAGKTVRELEALAEKYPDETEILISLAQGMVWLGCVQEEEQAAETVDRLEALAGAHPDVTEIAVRYARSLVNLSNIQEEEGMLATVARLEELAAEYPDAEYIVIQLAEGLFNLSHDQDNDEGLETVGRLEELAAKYPDITDISFQYAKGLANLSYQSEGAVTGSLVDRLEKVVREHLDISSIAAMYAIGLANLSYDQEGGETFQTVGKLENLVASYPGEMPIIASYAEGLANLCFEENETLVSRAFERLEELTEEYPDSDHIREQYARAVECLEDESWEEEPDEKLWEKDSDGDEPVQEAEAPNGGEMLPAYAGSFACQGLEPEQQEAVRDVEKLQSLLLNHPDDTGRAVEFARGLRGLCGIPGALCWQASAMLEYLSGDYPDEDVMKELARGWVLLSRVVDEMSAVMVNARLDGLVLLNPYLADVVQGFKGELDKTE